MAAGAGTGVVGDVDGDGDVDLLDVAAFQECRLGADTPYPYPFCLTCDADGDGDVDMRDWGRALLQFTDSPDLIVGAYPLEPNDASSGAYFSVGNNLFGGAQQAGFDPDVFNVNWIIASQPQSSGTVVILESGQFHTPFIIFGPASPGIYTFELEVTNAMTGESAITEASLLLTELGGICGDGQLDPGEFCDDGNTVSGDGCSAQCQFESSGDPPSFITAPPDLGLTPGNRISEGSTVSLSGAKVVDNDATSDTPLRYAWKLMQSAECSTTFHETYLTVPFEESVASFGGTLTGEVASDGTIPPLTFAAPSPVAPILENDDISEVFDFRVYAWDPDNCPECSEHNLPAGQVVYIHIKIGVRRSQFYVSPSGDNSHFGGQRRCNGSASGIADEWRSLSQAHAWAKPGDTVHIKEGVYLAEQSGESRPVLEITKSGEPNAPITFRAFRRPNGRYDNVTLDAEFEHDRAVWIHNCEHIVIDGLIATGAKREGFLLGVGGAGFSPFEDPVAHIVVRNCLAIENSGPNTSHGGFTVSGPSHDIVFDRCDANDCGKGFIAGVPHHLVKSQQPRRITWLDCIARNNIRHGENSDGFTLAGAHDCVLTRCVAVRNVDDGFNSQGPHCDNNIFEYCVAYEQNADDLPNGDGEGFKINNINNGILTSGYSGGRNGIVRHCVAFDNLSRGFDDTDGSHNTRYYSNVSYRNGAWGFLLDSNAGQSGTGVSLGATLINNIGHANQLFYTNSNGDDTDFAPAYSQNPILFSDYNFAGDGRLPGSHNGAPASWDNNSIGGTHDDPMDPLFVDFNPTCDINLYTGDPAFRIPNPNFARVTGLGLLGASPCVDQGTYTGQLFDPEDGNLNGTAEYDMGASEFIP
jgi:cysteine-rich repeat protein